LFSHPNKELKLHLNNVKKLGMNIFEARKTLWSNDKDILKALEIILGTHDFGKGTTYFQEYIVDTENEKFKKSPFMDLKKHGEFSALWSYYLVMKETQNEKLALIAYMVVRKHHGDLTDFKAEEIVLENDGKDLFYKQLENFGFEYFNLLEEKESFLDFIGNLKAGIKFQMRFKKSINSFTEENFILCNYLFSILISADKGEAIFYDKGVNFEVLEEIKENRTEIKETLVDEYKKKKFSIKNQVDQLREDIYKDIEKTLNSVNLEEEKIFSINVPTGTGKTLASFNTALKLRKKLGKNNRIIYNLPFTSVIDQNYSVFEDVLGEVSKDSSVLLKHHYLARKEYIANEGEVYEYDISKYLIENWDSEIIVTTFIQFLNSIITNKNRNLKKYHNLANSIIILDEVQSIPYKYWKLINKTLKLMTKTLNCYVILVTATMPLIFSEKDKEIIELASEKEKYFSFFNRIDMDISMIKGKISIDEFNQVIYEDISNNEEDSFLFVLNTIKSSLKIYEFINENFSDREIIYLSTNIVPKERLERIKRIKESKNCIVVATQMVEAGVDIDLDRVYRDFGPLDSINQVCGRCNRNGSKDKKGIVKLFNLSDDNNKDKEFYTYVYKDQILGNYTRKTFEGYSEIIEEKDFFNLSNTYFNYVNNAKADDNSDEIIKKINTLSYDELKIELIPYTFKTVDLFICIDEEAENLWIKYKEIYSKNNNANRYEKQAEFNKIKRDFLSYVISVPDKFFKEGNEGFNCIEKIMLEQYYDEFTGFKREEKQEDYFF
jgi:CRISPR-associated endonuclease/helicase Cas3